MKCIIGILSMSALLFACTNSGTKTTVSTNDSLVQTTNVKADSTHVNYAGVYKTTGEKGCNFTITLTKENETYNYTIQGEGLNATGKADIETVNSDTYITFDGKIADNAPKTIEGQLSDSTITIQNEGNSMNNYNYFKQCDSKYIEFNKVK